MAHCRYSSIADFDFVFLLLIVYCFDAISSYVERCSGLYLLSLSSITRLKRFSLYSINNTSCFATGSFLS